MSNGILLSIIIPIYNSEKYIGECMESIINQDESNVEIILINDGSTDSSLNICHHYSQIDKRVKVINKENGGVSNARNSGISLAKGKYIMFVDSDDILEYEWNHILEYVSDDDVYYFNNNIPTNASKMDMLKYIIGYNDLGLCFAGPFSKIFKRNFLIEKQIKFDEDLINGEDMLFNVSALLKCNSFRIINASFYHYRNYTGSATKSFNQKILKSDMHFHTKLNNCMKTSNVESMLRDHLSLYSIQMAIIVILNRVAYIKNYQCAKEYFKFLDQSPYQEGIQETILINKKFRVIFKLIHKRMYHIVYIVLKTKNKLNRLLGKKYYFRKI